MDGIVVARTARATIVMGTIVGLAIFALVPARLPLMLTLAVAAALVAAVRRLAAMAVIVTPEAVVVQNFWSHHEIPLTEVRITDVVEPRPRFGHEDEAPGDDRVDGARSLYLEDGTGRRVRVGLAPLYGSGLDDLAEDLYRAIAVMRDQDGPDTLAA